MKTRLEWKEYKSALLNFADEYRGKFDKLYGISRKGMVPATMLAIEWGMELGVCRMVDDGCIIDNSKYSFGARTKIFPDYFAKCLFVDDVVAEGRTIKRVRETFQGCKYLTIVQDTGAKEEADYGLMTCDKKEWIVFPWERFEKVKDQDRGLYREGTDSYGQ